jgi:hypothetical protein
MNNDNVHLQICRSIKDRSAGGRTAEEPENTDRPLRIVVPYTTPELTKAALDGASGLAADLRAEAVLLAIREIPYPLPLDRPDVQPAILIEQFKALTDGMCCPVRIELMLTRRKRDAFREALGPGSLVLIARKWHWWRTDEERLAHALTRTGCIVSLLTLRKGKRGFITRQLSHEATLTSARAAIKEVRHA